MSARKGDYDNLRPQPLTEDALRENEGHTRAMDFQTGGDSILDLYGGYEGTSIAGTTAGFPGMDDTCFSTFSAVPNTDMTLFAQIGRSPDRKPSPAKRDRVAQYVSAAPTPRPLGRTTPATAKRPADDNYSPSPTPRRPQPHRDADTTNLILDFTEQFNAFSQTSSAPVDQQGRPTPRKFNTQPDLAAYTATKRAPSPSKHAPSTPSRAYNLANLLDFDLPPAPTPRSVPTITARELESLKSTFLSQISSLRATLNGKEAEVKSLKEAVEDAERRVGEAQEEIRDQRGQKESLQAEKDNWQARDEEMHTVLRNVKNEIMHEQHEHEKLQQRLEASEKRREEAEEKILEADSKIAGLQASAAADTVTGSDGQASQSSSNGGNAAVEVAVEKVARELHGLYKSKHETKVTALKKSYEARWEKKIKDLESRITVLSHENEELSVARDSTLTGAVPPFVPPLHTDDGSSGLEKERVRIEEVKRFEEQTAQLAGLTRDIRTFKQENQILQQELEKERLEMAELVKATEEMMQLSLQTAAAGEANEKPTSGLDNMRGSISKTSSAGWKQSSFGAGESRIGRMGGGGGGGSGGGSTGFGGTRSGIMSNIERMGRGRAID
ncbi:MAG: hypothetical protein Q9220_001081 [cf. Caloplaca sp. 1 TL-2023]